MKNLNFTKAVLMLIASILLFTPVFSCNDSASGDGNGMTAEDLEGVWLKDWDGASFQYSETGEADMLIFDIGTDITAVFYYQTRQVGGFKGTFTIENGSLVISASDLWNEEWEDNEELPVWNEQETPEEYIFPFTLSGDILSITAPDDTVIELQKTAFSLSEEVSGLWEEEDNSDNHLSLSLSNVYSYEESGGEYYYEEGTWSASGTDAGYLRTHAELMNQGDDDEVVSLEGLIRYQDADGEGITLIFPENLREFLPYYPPAED